jgi:membrane protease YdiL (CAAX protease family)
LKTNPLLKAALFLSLAAVAVVGYLFLLSVFRGKLGAFSGAVPAILLAAAALVLNWRFFAAEGRSLAEIGFDRPAFRIGQALIGFVAGGLLIGMWVIVLVAVLRVSWQMTATFSIGAVAGPVTFAIFNNAGEELVYRGYLFLLLSRSYGRVVAVIATCTLFTLLHIQSGVPWLSAVAVVFTSALVFSALFVRWQSVPLVLGFHVATNVLQELLGLRVSAMNLFVPISWVKVSEAQSYKILAATAAINTIVALAIFATGRRPRPEAP